MTLNDLDRASLLFHANTAVEAALSTLVLLVPLTEVELPSMALYEAADRDVVYRRLAERATISYERVAERLRPDIEERLQEALRCERERGERLALIAWLLALASSREQAS
jgi:hypothetical protein